MSNKFRRWLAILMSALMLLSALPAGAATDETAPSRKKCPQCGSSDYASGYEEWWKDQTCTQAGRVELAHCYSCDYHKFEDRPALGHKWDEWKGTQTAMPPSCTMGGTQVRYCLRCKEMESRQVGPLGHDWREWVYRKQPTCTEGGTRYRQCNRCGASELQDVGPLGHDWGSWKMEGNPTCIELSTQTRRCHRCDKKDKREGYFGDHRWSDWYVAALPKPCSKGYEERKCSLCGKTEQRPLYPEGTLFRGDRGDAVKELQQALNDAGYDCGTADGIFGGNTENAIKQFQEDQGMEPDGVGYPCLPGRLKDQNEPLDYTGSMQLELISAPDAYYGKAGGIIELRYRLTNTGNTTLSCNRYHLADSADHDVDYSGVEYSDNSGDRWGWFKPGDSYEVTLRVTVTEADIAMGQIVRKFTELGGIWVGENGIPGNWEGSEGIQSMDPDKPIQSNTVTSTVPVGTLDYTGSLQLELISAPTAYHGAAGGIVELRYRLTNTGNTTLSCNRYHLADGADHDVDYSGVEYSDNSDGDWGHFMPGESYEVTLRVAVTEADIALGQIVRKFTQNGGIWVGSNGIPKNWEGSESNWSVDPDKPIHSNTVTATVPVGGRDFSGAMNLEVISAPTAFAGAAGDTVQVTYRLTNIGDTYLCAPFYNFFDGADVMLGQRHNTSSGKWLSIVPGDSMEFTAAYTVTPKDIQNGQIVRKLQYHGDIWLGANGIPMGWEGAQSPADHTTASDVVVSNTASVTIPMGEMGFGGQLNLEAVSVPMYFGGDAGDVIEVTYRLTNIGDTSLYIDSYQAWDGADNLVTTYSYFGSGSHVELAPGKSMNVTVPYPVNDLDMQQGQIVRKLRHFGDIWMGQNGIPMGWEGSEYPASHGYGELVSCNTVTILVPMGDEPTPWWVEDVSFVKSVNGNTPFAYGTPAKLGDTIEYLLTVTNNSDMTMHDVEICDPLKGNNEDAMVTLGDTLEPGQSMTYSFTYTVQANDIMAGQVVNTANLRWWFVDGEPGCELYSNTVIVPTSDELWNDDQPAIEKQLLNTPANGAYFMPGETAAFLITLRNKLDTDMYMVQLYDMMYNADGCVQSDLGKLDVLGAGVERTFTFMYTITEADAVKGYVENYAVFNAYNANQMAFSMFSEPVYVPCSPDFVVPTMTAFEHDIILTKTETSTPANGAYYVLGETIDYEITVKNAGEVGVGLCVVLDTLFNPKNNYYYDVQELDSFMQLYAGEERTFTFSHVVDETNVEDGMVKNGAEMTFDYDGVEYTVTSNLVKSPVGSEDAFSYPGLTFVKSLAGAPANGLYYVPGEEVHFTIYLNNNYQQLTDLVVEDALAFAPLSTIPSLSYGQTRSWLFNYTVTDWDAMNGSLTNVATLTAVDENGRTLTISDVETVPTGFPGGFGVITEMFITKTEVSMPANGLYYTEGETISYDIFIRNDGERDFGECIMYDSQAPADISSVEHLYVGEERHFPFNHVVTAQDVAQGYVLNTAWVEYDNNGYTETKKSNMVVSDTDGVPEMFHPEDPGTIDSHVTLGGEGEGYQPCSHELLAKGENGEEILTHYCELHADTREAVLKLVGDASTEEARLAAWTQASELWKAEIDEMYEALLNAADPLAKINIMDDRIRFYAAAACHEKLLGTVYPDDPVQAASMLAEMLMDKSVDMCYELHTAPADRIDAFEHVSGFEFNQPCGEECGKNAIVMENGDVRVAEQLCARHAAVLQMRNRLLASDVSAEEVWATVGQMWKIEVNTGCNGLYITFDEAQQATVLADYKAFENSIAAHEKVLSAMYDRAEVVKEVLAQTMQERAMEICGYK